jgi:hypothetical protein
MASQLSATMTPMSRPVGIGGSSQPPAQSSFPPPPCSPGDPHLVASAAALLSETTATPVESAAPLPRDDDSVDVELLGLGLRVQSSTDHGSNSVFAFRSGQNSVFPPPMGSAALFRTLMSAQHGSGRAARLGGLRRARRVASLSAVGEGEDAICSRLRWRAPRHLTLLGTQTRAALLSRRRVRPPC